MEPTEEASFRVLSEQGNFWGLSPNERNSEHGALGLGRLRRHPPRMQVSFNGGFLFLAGEFYTLPRWEACLSVFFEHKTE